MPFTDKPLALKALELGKIVRHKKIRFFWNPSVIFISQVRDKVESDLTSPKTDRKSQGEQLSHKSLL